MVTVMNYLINDAGIMAKETWLIFHLKMYSKINLTIYASKIISR